MHFPASIFCSTVGGFVSTRAAGQLSAKYGKIEDMVVSLEVVLPTGEIIKTKNIPRSSTGPSLTQLFLGSEGTLGIITEITFRIHRFVELFLKLLVRDLKLLEKYYKQVLDLRVSAFMTQFPLPWSYKRLKYQKKNQVLDFI